MRSGGSWVAECSGVVLFDFSIWTHLEPHAAVFCAAPLRTDSAVLNGDMIAATENMLLRQHLVSIQEWLVHKAAVLVMIRLTLTVLSHCTVCSFTIQGG